MHDEIACAKRWLLENEFPKKFFVAHDILEWYIKKSMYHLVPYRLAKLVWPVFDESWSVGLTPDKLGS